MSLNVARRSQASVAIQSSYLKHDSSSFSEYRKNSLQDSSHESSSKSIKLEKDQSAGAKVSLKKKIKYLDYKKRPKWLQSRINEAFKTRLSRSESTWEHNGKVRYNVSGVNEHALMKKLIQQGYAEGRREFHALDIGAGKFQWSRALADFIDKDSDLPQDIKVCIIGIGGEPYSGSSFEKTKLCKIHNLAKFKIEELGEWFKKREFHLENEVDLIVSTWCFRHLVDPVGTFIQTYELLRPTTGFLLMDGFQFLRQQESVQNAGSKNMTQLALDTRFLFLMRNTVLDNTNHYVFQKPSADPCQLPMRYLGVEDINKKKWSIGSGSMLRFYRKPQEKDEHQHYLLQEIFEKTVPIENQGGGNDKRMYDWLQKNHLLEGLPLMWKSL